MFLMLGDVHARFGTMLLQYNEAKQSFPISHIIQVGDFGFFADRIKDLKFPVPTYFIDGNHENFWDLKEFESFKIPNLFFIRRGETVTLEGVTFGGVGGSEFMDKVNTTYGAVFSDYEIEKLLDKQVDIILTHDCPSDLGVPGSPEFSYLGQPGSKRLSLLKALKPKRWFFGHYHKNFHTVIDDIKYDGINCSTEGYGILCPKTFQYSFYSNSVRYI